MEDRYRKSLDILMKEFEIKNRMAVPKLVKVVVNSGVGSIDRNKEMLDFVLRDIALITGQKPSVRRARMSISSFDLRKGQPVGVKVTLRNKRALSFLERLFSVVLPRLNDFRGVSIDSFDKNGNYTLGLSDHTVFPEIDLSKTVKPFGMEITIVTSTRDKQKSKRLLELLGMPFEKS